MTISIAGNVKEIEEGMKEFGEVEVTEEIILKQ